MFEVAGDISIFPKSCLVKTSFSLDSLGLEMSIELKIRTNKNHWEDVESLHYTVVLFWC